MQDQFTIACVIGTRPEAIKMAPVVRALHADSRFRCVVIATAQHRGLLDQMLKRFGIEVDYDLDLMTEGQSPSELIARMLPALDRVLSTEAPSAVLAQGDTTTVFGAAVAAYHRCISFGHVEAGLRTGDLYHPFPEEGYRQMVARIARWHFAPTSRAAAALRREGIPAARIHVTGNTCIDMLLQTVSELEPSSHETGRMILLTAHRRESFGAPLQSIFRAVRRIVDRYADVNVVYPVHPNPNVRNPAFDLLAGHPRIALIEPVDYYQFVDLMRRSVLILTDSGGIQEEAPALGKPVLVLRDTTERPEALQSGGAILVGTDCDNIEGAVMNLLNSPEAYASMTRSASPYGDGHAAERIVELLAAAAVHDAGAGTDE